MHLRKAFACLFLGFVISLPAFSQPANQPFDLSFQQAYEMALTQNPSLIATRRRLGVSDAEIRAAAFHPNPSLLLSYTPAEDLMRIGGQQQIQFGFKQQRRVAVARAQRDVVTAEIAVAVLNTRLDLRRGFTQLYVAQERVSLLDEVQQTTEKLLQVAQVRERAGDIPRYEVLQARVGHLTARNDYQLALYQVVQQKATLNSLLGRSGHETLSVAAPDTSPQIPIALAPATAAPITLKGVVDVTDINLDGLLKMANESRPELRANTLGIEVTRRQESLAKANRIPNATFSAGMDYNYEERKPFVFAAASIELPLLYRQQGEIRGALARRLQLEAERQQIRVRINAEVTSAYANYLGNRKRLEVYENELLPESKQLVNAARLGFEYGKTPLVTSLQAQQAYVQTRLGYLQALQDYQNAISDLERAVGAGL